ncbi:MAG: peptidoglycan editing factor PgeF [Acidobacteria bacterium]|nr:peptidoglycan editing factor PgeF [Acidobacteriota bacterium]MBI3658433.1 peptidoglycan editing factor PgeF [Acidobacteriota bacterium]
MTEFILKRAGGLAFFVFRRLEEYRFLTHGFSTRLGGVSPFPGEALNLGYIAEDDARHVALNRSRFLAALNIPQAELVTLHQVHSSQIHILNNAGDKTKSFLADRRDPAPDPHRYGEGDGLVTNRPGCLLTIQTADCFPILLIDQRQRAVGGLHAGWRGACQRIAERGVETMQIAFQSKPEDLIAAIGPGIGPCCYEVGDEVVEAYNREFQYGETCFHRPDGAKRRRLDLRAVNRRQLLDAGLSPDQILEAGRCTACEPEYFFSHRAEKGVTGRMMAAIALR